MTTYQTIEDFDNAFIETQEAETDALFRRGEVMAAAIDSGIAKREVIRRAKYLSRRSERTVRYYLNTWQVFKDHRNPELDWSFHQLCATTKDPLKWLDIAANGYQNEKGEHCGHTYRTLKAALKANGEDPTKGEPIYLLDNEQVTIQRLMLPRLPGGCYELVLNLKQPIELPEFGTPVYVTLVVQAPAETEAA